MTAGDIRVVIADDHPVVRDALSALLASVPSVTVRGVAADGREAVEAAVTLRPDVLIMDIQMPELTGVEAARQITRAAPGVAVLMLTMFDDDYSVLAAMRAGARGYVLKGAQQDEIIRAVHAVAAGEAIFGPGVARLVLSMVAAPPAAEVPFGELTGREREVLDLVAAGVRNAEIARRMSIAPKTVANHISAIFAKLQVTDRGEAIILARDASLGRDSRASRGSPPSTSCPRPHPGHVHARPGQLGHRPRIRPVFASMVNRGFADTLDIAPRGADCHDGGRRPGGWCRQADRLQRTERQRASGIRRAGPGARGRSRAGLPPASRCPQPAVPPHHAAGLPHDAGPAAAQEPDHDAVPAGSGGRGRATAVPGARGHQRR